MKAKYFNLFSLLLAAFFIFFVAGCAADNACTPKKWTVLLYLDGDDVNMQSDFLDNLEEMTAAGVGSNAAVNIVVQFDRYPEQPDMPGADPRYGGWVVTHRFYLTPGLAPTEANAVKDWGDGRGGREMDMSDPDALADFINWAKERFPAEHYLLMVADHGYGWKGLAADETSFGSHMTLRGLKQALDRTGVHFDLLAFNACLMQMVEVAYELADSKVDYMVGSEMPGMKWPLAPILQAVADNPALSAREIGKIMNDCYVDAQSPYGSVTLSTLDLSQIGALTDKIKELVAALLNSGDFSIVQEKARAVMAGIEAAVVYSRANVSYCHGLSIYFHRSNYPNPPPDDFSYFYQPQITRFSTAGKWRDFLTVFYDLLGHPQYRIDNRIFAVRQALTDLEDPNVDLYDFCRRIVEYADN